MGGAAVAALLAVIWPQECTCDIVDDRQTVFSVGMFAPLECCSWLLTLFCLSAVVICCVKATW